MHKLVFTMTIGEIDRITGNEKEVREKIVRKREDKEIDRNTM